MISAAVAKKRLALSKKADTTIPISPSKRPRQEIEPARERVKKLAQKGEREIHLISSQTTEATKADAHLAALVTQDLSEQRPILIGRAS